MYHVILGESTTILRAMPRQKTGYHVQHENRHMKVGVQPVTSQHVTLKIHSRKWHFPTAKSTRLIALVAMRITAGANAWRKVEGVMGV